MLTTRNRTLAIKKGATWGTPTAKPTTGCGILITSFTPPKGARAVTDDGNEYGKKMPANVYALNYQPADGSFTAREAVAGLEAVNAALYGIYTASAPAETTVITHTYVMDDGEIDEIFFTMAWDGYATDVWAVPSAKVKKITYASNNGEITETVDFTGSNVSLATWTNLIGAVTYPYDNSNIHKLLNTAISVNAQGGSDFSGSDVVQCNNWSFENTRGLMAMPPESGTAAVQSPIDAAAPLGILTLHFTKSSATTNAYYTAFQNGTQYKAKIVRDAGVISGKTAHYLISQFFPKLQLVEAPDISQANGMPVVVKFKVLKAASAPTGMAYGVPYMTQVNETAALTGYPAS